MGFLDVFRREDKKEKDIYQTLLIQRLINDIEELKQRVKDLEQSQEKKKGTQDKEKLTNLEEFIYTSYINQRPENIYELSKITNIKETSLRVYVSKIRGKGYQIKFNS